MECVHDSCQTYTSIRLYLFCECMVFTFWLFIVPAKNNTFNNFSNLLLLPIETADYKKKPCRDETKKNRKTYVNDFFKNEKVLLLAFQKLSSKLSFWKMQQMCKAQVSVENLSIKEWSKTLEFYSLKCFISRKAQEEQLPWACFNTLAHNVSSLPNGPLTPPPCLNFGAWLWVCGATLTADGLMLLHKLVLRSGQTLERITKGSFFREIVAGLSSSSSVIYFL